MLATGSDEHLNRILSYRIHFCDTAAAAATASRWDVRDIDKYIKQIPEKNIRNNTFINMQGV